MNRGDRMFVGLIFFIVDIVILAVLSKGLDQGRAEIHEFCRLEYSRTEKEQEANGSMGKDE
jgi:hypothetical protein